MSDRDAPTRGRRRRPVLAAERAERKQRRQQRHAQARARQQRIDAAEESYFDAADTIVAVDAERDEQLAELDARAQRVREHAETRTEQQRRRQRHAVATLREEGCQVDEIADILEIPATRVRAYLSEHRRHEDTADTATAVGDGIAATVDASAIAEPAAAVAVGADNVLSEGETPTVSADVVDVVAVGLLPATVDGGVGRW